MAWRLLLLLVVVLGRVWAIASVAEFVFSVFSWRVLVGRDTAVVYVTENGDADGPPPVIADERLFDAKSARRTSAGVSVSALLLLPERPGSSGVAVSISVSSAERTTRRPELPPPTRCMAALLAVLLLKRLGVVKADMSMKS